MKRVSSYIININLLEAKDKNLNSDYKRFID